MRKNVQISYELFEKIVFYHLANEHEHEKDIGAERKNAARAVVLIRSFTTELSSMIVMRLPKLSNRCVAPFPQNPYKFNPPSSSIGSLFSLRMSDGE